MGKRLASQQCKLKQIQVTQRSSADCSDKGPSFHWAAWQHLFFFHMCLFSAGRKGSMKNGPEIPVDCSSAHAQFSKPPNWSSTSKCTYSWRGNNLFWKSWHHSWSDAFKKKLKLFPPQVPRWISPKQISQASYLIWGAHTQHTEVRKFWHTFTKYAAQLISPLPQSSSQLKNYLEKSIDQVTVSFLPYN